MLQSKRLEGLRPTQPLLERPLYRHTAHPLFVPKGKGKQMQIMNKLSNIARSLNSRPSTAEHRDTYCFPANGTEGYSSYVWVKDYNSGLYLRVPV